MNSRAGTIFLEALQLPPGAEREAFLNEACGNDAEMRRQVDDMLADDSAAENFFDSEAAGGRLAGRVAHAGVAQRIMGAMPGGWIDRYQLIEILGEGGFGTVWHARQHEPIQREVALKLVKPGMDSAEIVARFFAERQALAMMDHPNIAAVLDAGQTDAGLPFFVMELVQGQPVTTWCDANRFSIRQRLELFAQICLAVHHAHQKAILHRDLKPSNILVEVTDNYAVPKIIDFGIAKALQAGLAPQFGAGLARTIEGMVIGTPQYMSPEQAESRQDIDTRSDVYALGVILYELLTGETPLRKEQLRGIGIVEILQLVRDTVARRPSSRLIPPDRILKSVAAGRATAAKRLGPAVKGELDWIVLKALEKDRNRRYQSAEALANDIQRFLADRPVAARAPTVTYRLSKFAKRNRGLLGAAAAVAFTIVAAAGITSLISAGARSSKDKAEKEADEEKEKARIAALRVLEEKKIRDDAEKAAALAKGEAYAANSKAASATAAAEKSDALVKNQHRVSSAADFGSAQQAFSEGDWRKGVVYLGRALLTDINNQDAQQALWIALTCGISDAEPVPVESWLPEICWEARAASPDGERLFLTVKVPDSGEVMVDGKLVKVKGGPPQIREARSGRLISSLNLDAEKNPSGVIFSPDGTRLATGTYSGQNYTVAREILLFDVASGRQLAALKGSTHCMEFSPDGQAILLEGSSAGLALYDTTTGRLIREFKQFDGDAEALCFSPRGDLVAVINRQGGVTVWRTVDGERVQFLPPAPEKLTHPGRFSYSPRYVRINSTGNRLVTALPYDVARLWNLQTGKLITNLGVTPKDAEFTPDSARLVVSTQEGTGIWDADNGRRVGFMREAKDPFKISPDGRCILSTMGLWDLEHEALVLRLTHGYAKAAFRKSGEEILVWENPTADFMREVDVRIYHAGSRLLKGEPLPMKDEAAKAAFSPSATRLFTTTRPKPNDDTSPAIVWDAKTLRQLFSFPVAWITRINQPTGKTTGGVGGYVVAEFSPDASRIVIAGPDKSLSIRDTFTGAEMSKLTGHMDSVFLCRFSPDGRTFLTAGNDRTVRMWKFPEGTPYGKPMGHPEFLMTAVFNSDGTRILTLCGESELSRKNPKPPTLIEWDAATGDRLESRDGGPDAPYNFGKKYEQLGYLNKAMELELGMVKEGFQIYSIRNNRLHMVGPPLVGGEVPGNWSGKFHTNGILVSGDRACFDRTGFRAATCGPENVVRLWDSATPQLLPDGNLASQIAAAVSAAYLEKGSGQMRQLLTRKRLELFESVQARLNTPDLSDWALAIQQVRRFEPGSRWSVRGESTIRDVATRLITSGQKQFLAEAYRIDPAHPLMHFAFSLVESGVTAAAFLKDYSAKRIAKLPPEEQKAMKALAAQLLAGSGR